MVDKIQAEKRDLEAFRNLIEAPKGTSHSYVLSDYDVKTWYPVDEETGLPALPEGYFWKVYDKYGTPYVGLYHQEVVERKVDFGFWSKVFTTEKSRLVDDRHINRYSVGSKPELILKTAYLILTWFPEYVTKNVYPESYESYYGDYPPKSLNP